MLVGALLDGVNGRPPRRAASRCWPYGTPSFQVAGHRARHCGADVRVTACIPLYICILRYHGTHLALWELM